MIKKRHQKGFATIGIFCVMGFGIFTNPYIINNCTNFYLHYRWIESKDLILSPNYMFLGYTPNGKYALHMLNHSWFGTTLKIETTQWGSRKPKPILSFSEERLQSPIGPLEKEFDIVCSKDSRHVAMVCKGWFVDSYDFENETRNSVDIGFMGTTKKADMEKWGIYHNIISQMIGNDFVSVLKIESN